MFYFRSSSYGVVLSSKLFESFPLLNNTDLRPSPLFIPSFDFQITNTMVIDDQIQVWLAYFPYSGNQSQLSEFRRKERIVANWRWFEVVLRSY